MTRRDFLTAEIDAIDNGSLPAIEQQRSELENHLAALAQRETATRIIREILGEAYAALPEEEIEEEAPVVVGTFGDGGGE